MGLASTQTLGDPRRVDADIPEARTFMAEAAEHGVSSAVAARDGRFGTTARRRPTATGPENVIDLCA